MLTLYCLIAPVVTKHFFFQTVHIQIIMLHPQNENLNTILIQLTLSL